MEHVIEAHPGLRDEVIEIYQAMEGAKAHDIVVALNTPARVQQRGFQVRPEHLVAVLIDAWRIDDKSRFILYDFDEELVLGPEVYKDQQDASIDADMHNNVAVLRIQVP